MKILYLITKSEAGGAQTHVADLCRYFKNCGNEVTVMSAGDGWLKNECDKLGVVFIANKYFSNSPNPFRIFYAIREIKRCVKNFQPDIVHCHSSAAAFLGRLAVRGKVRTIYTAHGWGFNIGMNPFVRVGVLIAEKLAAKYTDTYICVAEFVKKLGLKYNLAPAKKFKVIYNGVSVRQTASNISSVELKLIFVGRLAEPKRPELIIEAISRLPSEIKCRIIFTIVGDGPKRKSLEDLSKEKKVTVHFTGALPKESALGELSRGDIFVFISAWEGFPYTILEAMSYGLPVIASNVGGVSEAIDSTCGILVNNDVGQIREAILKLCHDKGRRLRMGDNARKIVEQKFSLEKMLKEIEHIYKNI
ncbi:MAG: glycosyltransferase family 4 protein [Patescibacteria group bacterium]